MFDIEAFYQKENSKVETSYKETIKTIKEISTELEKIPENSKKEYFILFKQIADNILFYYDFEEKINEDYFYSKDIEQLLEENRKLFAEILPENYETSYCNPTHCVKVFGDKFGQLISYFYSLYRNYISFAFMHKRYKMEEHSKLFIDAYNVLKEKEIDYEILKEALTKYEHRDRVRDYNYQSKENYDPDYGFYKDIILNADLNDYRYLFRMGKYITENEIRTAKFMSSYPAEGISKLAKTIVDAFVRGFKRDGKDIKKKSVTNLYYFLGMERLYKEVINELGKIDMKVAIQRVISTSPNKQFPFDHKFDRALSMSKKQLDKIIAENLESLEITKELFKQNAGPIAIISFGEEPFSPVNKPENIKYTEEQTALFQDFNRRISEDFNKYQSREETSFCIIAFPSPEIGEKFEEIFAETVEINMIDTVKIENIQQKIIDVLDQADIVHVKGAGDNETNFKIKMQSLQNPEKETNYVNSGSSVNIPAGEVFTSPQLQSTNGILHVKETYQNGLLFKDLKIEFKDGYTENYSCTNFDSDEENHNYIEQNLLFPHKSLPIGEFAIGTNTKAYVVSRQYDILDVLPILISEKTAPHFAIGDTCFARGEEVKRINAINKKQVMACDNEKSILRKTERKAEAYTYIHKDIVMPFDDIDFITAILKTGEKIDIIRNGRFVVPGTEELNIPLDNYEKK